ncbi:MAG: 4-alpha-glucanotransferase, partial [Xanthomonadales bacterium]|nr:4-alpha-glucanotransferase [Xanthomonadales bacterium]
EDSEADQIAELKIIQFLFHHQWQRLRRHAHEKGVLLFGDMPIYISFDSADAWAHPEILRIDKDGQPDAVAGVPPDYFSEEGQLWGNPLYDWDYHAKGDFRWWVARLRHTAKQMDLVRIDHFRGFEAFWAVPSSATSAKEGAWEPGPGDAIFDAIREALGDLPIIAEDLGEITPAVDALRARQRIPGMRVLQFEAGEDDFDLSDIEAESVCYTGTHDNDTTVGWFRGAPGDTRTVEEIKSMQTAVLRHTGGTPESIHLDLIRLAFSSRARIAIAQMQDYLGLDSEARMNRPGTTGNNWRWRLQPEQLSPQLQSQIHEMVKSSGRC